MKMEEILKTAISTKPTKLVSAFPATGKSHYYENTSLDVLDSDSSKFDKTKFPQNYIEHIKNNLGKVDIIFISSHKPVRDALVNEGLEFTLIYPNIDLKDEYMERYKNRGNSQSFIDLLDTNWNNWIVELSNQEGCEKIELQQGQYISDVL